ncbi:MAG: HNH endonuclease, partial [bacterium]
YGTMFDFATRYLRYSASAAGRRIQVARCVARHPELLEPLRTREINLSTIALIAGILDDGNVHVLIDAIRGKSQREVEQIAATYRPAVEVRDRVRPVRGGTKVARRDANGDAAPLFADAARSVGGGTNGHPDAGRIQYGVSHSRCGSGAGADRGVAHGGAQLSRAGESAGPEGSEPRFKIQFAAGPELVRKLEEARAILSTSPRGASLEQVLETALDAFLHQKSPFRRKERRDRSGARRKPETATVPRAAAHSRHVPAAVRDTVFARDGGRCAYVGANGVPCGSRHNLHVDHIEPFARGGPGTPENLRLLCAPHNQLEADRLYGVEWMRRHRNGQPPAT